MLGHSPFYHKHLKKYVSVFGTLFNDLSFIRTDKDGATKTIKVPLSFVNKDKALERYIQNPELRATWNSSFPRMAFTMNSFAYAPHRKENTVNYITKDNNGNLSKIHYPPAPYDIFFTLSVFASYYEDALQIVEQIIPFFQPEYVVAVKEIPELGIDRDVHIYLNSVTMDDNVEGPFEDGRLIEWTLEFTLQGFFYGPTSDRKVIKTANAEIFFNPEMSEPFVSSYTATVDPFIAERDEPHTIVETKIENA
jgi:hypothetical protein